jgi:fluoroquinolone resistance protein
MTEDKIFTGINYTENNLGKDEYENCTFRNCVFYNSNLSNIIFRNCVFDGCDLSLAQIKQTVLNDIKFINCKLLGLQFHNCNNFLFSVDFDNCMLKLSVFYKLKLKKTKFNNCNLQEADFTEADLTASVFANCDLQRAVFDTTNLETVDFRTAYNYSIDPERNKMKKARFSGNGITGLLDKYNIVIE